MAPFESLRAVAVTVAAALAIPATAATATEPREGRRGRASLGEINQQLDQVESLLKTSEGELRVVETQFTQRPEPSQDDALLQRFSDGEIQYLLGDYAGASVLFYDLISDEGFKRSAKYADALYYLADSLYQQKNFIGSQLYLKELLKLKGAGAHYREALARFLETAGRLNEFTGIDQYIQEARAQFGELSPDLSYVYGKWLFKRTDLPREERMTRASEVFEPLAADPTGPYRLQALYFLGVIDVQRAQNGDYTAAIDRFKNLLAQPSKSDRDQKVKEMGNLSLGRLYYEAGRYDEALDQYQEVPRESESFVDSLYEIAWVHVRKGEWEKAKNATDILLLVAPESTLAPEAQILQGHLLLKLKKYGDATDTYNGVINTYAPVRDEIDALLNVNNDPVAYFNNLLAKNEKNLDVASLLPPVALKWATTQREVADAVHMVSDLEAGRHGVDESAEIAGRILKALDERGLEAFPALQEGYTRADAVETALTQSEQNVVRLEGYLVEDALTPEEKAQYDTLKAQLDAFRERFASMPKTRAEVEQRKKRMQDEVDRIDKEAFKLGYEVQSVLAVEAATETFLDQTRAQRHDTPEDERAFREQLKLQLDAAAAEQKELDELRAQLRTERASADAAIAGEDEIRSDYADSLRKQHQLIASAEARLSPDHQRVIQHAHEVRQNLDALNERVAAAKGILRAQLDKRGKQIRQKVENEQKLLAEYGGEVSRISGNARDLVGRIAFDSFRRVRRQFYDLVLKADVGLVDVAFTRKQDKTQEIQKVSAEKDHQLRQLEDDFKEVLKDVD